VVFLYAPNVLTGLSTQSFKHSFFAYEEKEAGMLEVLEIKTSGMAECFDTVKIVWKRLETPDLRIVSPVVEVRLGTVTPLV
jgi:hypothetical protein